MTKGTTIAIILGAQEFPKSEGLPARASFAESASGVERYLKSDTGLALAEDAVLNLFDSADAPKEQLRAISDHIRTRQAQVAPLQLTDLLLYYVGHGGFDGDEYLIAIRTTEAKHFRALTSIRMKDLAKVLRHGGPSLRRILVLDCCFAAEAFVEFQSSGPLEVAYKNTAFHLPSSGTALLCASGVREPGRAPLNDQYTMFSGALLEVLTAAHRDKGALLSPAEVIELTAALIESRYEGGTRPEIHSPQQQDGDVAKIPFFPNRAYNEESEFHARVKQHNRAGLSEKFRDVVISDQEELAPYDRLLRSLIKDIPDDILGDQLLGPLLDRVVASNHAFPLRIDGQPGVGKSSFLSLLYLVAEWRYGSQQNNCLPVYYNVRDYLEPEYDPGISLKTLRNDLSVLEDVATVQRQRFGEVLLFIDGLDEDGLGTDELDGLLLNRARELKIKKLITVGLRYHPDLPSSRRKRLLWEDDHTRLLIDRKVFTKDEGSKLIEMIGSLPVYSWDAHKRARITNKLNQLRPDVIDWNTISLLAEKMNLPSYRGKNTLGAFYSQLCDELFSVDAQRGEEAFPDISEVARLAFRYAIQFELPEKVDRSVRRAWRLINRHETVKDYLIALHLHECLKSVIPGNETVLASLDYVYPKQISRFSKEIMASRTQDCLTLIRRAGSLLDSRRYNLNAHVAFLLGRVKEELREEARGVLKRLQAAIMHEVRTIVRPTTDLERSKLLLARTVYVSLAYLGDRQAAEEYVDLLIDNQHWDDLNRGFHLEYYGDLEFDPRTPLKHGDHKEDVDGSYRLSPWRMTYVHLVDTLKESSGHPLKLINIHTLFSLAQHRHVEGLLDMDQLRELSQLANKLTRDSELSVTLRTYLDMIVKHFKSERYPTGRIAEDLFGLKTLKRSGWVWRNIGMVETVAAHTFGAYLLGLIYLEEQYDLAEIGARNVEGDTYNKDEILQITLAHDLHEAYLGDLRPSEKSDGTRTDVERTLEYTRMLGTYRGTQRMKQLRDFQTRFEAGKGYNVEVARDLDKLDNLMQLFIFKKAGANIPDFEDWKAELVHSIRTAPGRRISRLILSNFALHGEQESYEGTT